MEWPDSRVVKLQLKSRKAVWRNNNTVTASRIRWVDDGAIPGRPVGEDWTMRPIGCRIRIVDRSVNIEYIEVMAVKVERVSLQKESQPIE